MPHRQIPQPQVQLDPGITAAGLSAGQGSIPPLPGGFSPVQTGIFSGGGFVDVDLSEEARAGTGRRAKRARRVFDNRVRSAEKMADVADVELTPELRAGVEQFVASGANRGAIAGLLDLAAERQRQEQQVQRGRLGAVEQVAAVTGVSRQGVATGAGFDPTLRATLEAAARGEPGAAASITAIGARSARGEAARQAALSESEQRNELLSLQVKDQRERTARETRAELIGNRRDLITDVEQNPAMQTGSKALRAASQLIDVTNDADFNALDLAISAVLFTQVIEPGLAVREDDRIAFNRGAQAGMQELKNTINQFSSGEIDGEQARLRVQASLFSIMRTNAQSMQESLGFWEGVAGNTRGAEVGDVRGALGMTPRMEELLAQFAAVPGTQR